MSDDELSKSVGLLAVPVETVVNENDSIEEAFRQLRHKQIEQKIIYFYAVDAEGKLKGVISTRQLLLANPSRKVKEIMHSSVVTISASHSLGEAMELFAKHPLLAIPVIDREGRLMGAIDVQMVTQEPINFADEQSRTDLFQIIGLSVEEKRKISFFAQYRHRMPWLLCNVFSGLVCAVISRTFELVLSKVLLLAFFIPLVLTLSESTSMQSMAHSLQLLRRPRFSWKFIQTRALQEWQLVVLVALTLAVLVGALSLFWGEGIFPSISIGIGIFFGVSLSAIFGIFVPIVLNRLKLDPKVASGPVVLMIVDILATAIYLGLATWWLL